jgi:hypothetical protein
MRTETIPIPESKTSRAARSTRLSALRRGARLGGFCTLTGLLVFTLACIDRPMKKADAVIVPIEELKLPQSAQRAVDILFVVDNSGSMADEQALLQAQFSSLMQTLRNMVGGIPDVHIGVTSTDLGTGMFQITYCEDAGGDQGHLLTGSCPNPTGATYIVDTEPQSCTIERDIGSKGELVACTAHDCAERHCTEPGTTLQIDENGCPRCRNYSGEDLEDAFSCVAGLGTLGCGFEQPLEAMYQALDPANAANDGFLREDAILAVVLITDEDDCSARNPQLFDNSQTSMDSTLGPLTSFRCFEFGITCDVNSRSHQGLRQDCVPREDANALLHPVSRYTGFLRSLKAEEFLVVAAIAGPYAGSVTVGLDDYSQPEVQPSCSTERGGAVPGVRLKAFVEAFNEPDEMAGAYTSICSPTYADALQGVADNIAVLLDTCPAWPLQGCSDPGVLYGLPGDGRSCNDNCQPRCSVQDVVADESRTDVPRCVHVCPTGLCLDNADPTAAYAGGHPDRRDPDLPVPACWHVGYNEQCAVAHGAEIVISRQADPPPRTVTEAACREVVPVEELCQDGLDNDEDCLTDSEDPDCQ